MRPRIPFVGTERGTGLRQGLRQNGPNFARPKCAAHEHPGEQAMGLSVIGGNCNRAPAKRLGFGDFGARDLTDA